MLRVRLTSEEWRELERRAGAAGHTHSEYVRQAVLHARVRVGKDDSAMVRQVARVGNNLNQLARWANTHKAAGEAVRVIASLMFIGRVLQELKRRS